MEATTNLIPLNTQSTSVKSSSRVNTPQRQNVQKYKGNASNSRNFNNVFDKLNEDLSSVKNAINEVSDTVTDTSDPMTAAIKISAHGKSNDNNTQDAPQNQSQSTETLDDNTEEVNSFRQQSMAAINLLSYVSMNLQTEMVDAANVTDDNKVNLMTLLPQTPESDNKNQAMLNALSGRLWQLDQSNSAVQAMESTNNIAVKNLNILFDQQPIQSAENTAESLAKSLMSNEIINLNQLNLQNENQLTDAKNPLTTINEQSVLTETAASAGEESALIKNADLTNLIQLESENNDITNLPFKVDVETAPAQINIPVQQKVSTLNTNEQIAQQTPELGQLAATTKEATQSTMQPVQNNAIATNNEVQTLNSEITENPAQPTNQQATQSTLQNGQFNPQNNVPGQNQTSTTNNEAQTLSPELTENPAQSINQQTTQPILQNGQNNLLGQNQTITTNNEAQALNPEITENPTQPTNQQATQSTLQNEQSNQSINQNQSLNQTENVELPQVQSAVSEGQPINRQQVNQNNLNNLLGVEIETDNTQTVNQPQQAAQQQSQNQQQNLQQPTSQQSIISESENNDSSRTHNSGENFSSHFGAATNNSTQPQPAAVTSSEQTQTAQQTARQDFNITGQIVEHAKMIKTAQNTEMVIHLKPEHLGELTLRVSVTSNGSVNASFHSDNAQVRAIIENTLVHLKNELSNQGLKVDSVQVYAGLSDGGMMNSKGQQAWQQQNRQGSNSRQSGGRVGFNKLNDDVEAVSSASPVNQSSTEDGVDYRV
ncbi:MAG: flagellar hook-length control protein FliK [Selenomonadaceae bacterium]|nr:flagellar hook-length control protein FliK [Selenomonadaceae bacterium]